MKIAIISDTHDNLATLDKFLAYIDNYPVGAVIHCGDIAEGDTLKHLARNFSGPVFAVFGNMDYRDSVREAAKTLANVTLFEDFGTAKLDGLILGFCHHIETAKHHCKKENFDFVFYGHSHKPWKENTGGGCLANPGNLAGLIYGSTFAILDSQTKKLALKITNQL